MSSYSPRAQLSARQFESTCIISSVVTIICAGAGSTEEAPSLSTPTAKKLIN
jgi:hypothetical protein